MKTTLNIHQREAKLLRRVAEQEQENREQLSLIYKLDNRIAELEAENKDLSRLERLWETSMMYAIGEDGVGSVTQAIYDLKSDRDLMANQLQKWADKIRGSTDEQTDS